MQTNKMTNLAVSVIDEFNGPATFMLDPDEDDTSAVTGGESLIRFVPLHQYYLHKVNKS